MALKFILGQIAITKPGEAANLSASDLKVDSTSFDDDDCMYTGVRLSWTGSADHYEISSELVSTEAPGNSQARVSVLAEHRLSKAIS